MSFATQNCTSINEKKFEKVKKDYFDPKYKEISKPEFWLYESFWKKFLPFNLKPHFWT